MLKTSHRLLQKALIAVTLTLSPLQANTPPAKGFSAYGKVKYPDNFTHFDYVNPKAPKGGSLILGALGTFDSLNPFIVKGTPPAAINITHARLMAENADRAAESYPYLAESIEVDEDHKYVIFYLNPKAKFSDGHLITADDILWSFEILKTKGSPMYRTYYKNITKAEKLSDHAVKFSFDESHNAELPLILGQIPALPKHYYEIVAFDSTSLTPPPCSGPYQVETLDPGRTITFKRVEDWWGEDVPSQKGHYNFDQIRYDYYLDSNTQFESFKAGKIDIRPEASVKLWKTGYDFPAVKEGLVIREEIEHTHNAHTYGFFFNTRRPLFQDVRVREALTLAFDFNWANKHLFYGAYARNESYYPNSCFSARGLPDAHEKAVLDKHLGDLPAALFTTEFKLPEAKNPQEEHEILTRSMALLEQAGWHIVNQRLVNKKTNEPFQFELLIGDKIFEKVSLLLARNLKKLGINMVIKTPDTTTFTQRTEHQNYDVVVQIQGQSNSLGNEQRDFFGSSRAEMPGSRNLAGVKNPVVDELIEKLIQSTSYGELCSRGRALDRVLLWNYYMIPAWHRTSFYVAYWDKFGHPEVAPKFYPTVHFLTWWIDPVKEAELEKKLQFGEGKGFWERLFPGS